ncbi:amidase signature domain-containing protein [Penicillium hetheringtonii]|uniref:Amidase signature domain-containing protein n=1 Tax=Penicillium hetheringtonii TaxID=911720 RepID=A0AAD6DWM5_9EURO|nr:amidase signature domain-containing protein [Penicillium hetheringtonii]
MTVNRPWTVVVAAKRAIRDAQLRKYETADESLGSELCGTGMVDVEALTTLLRSGQLSAEDVIRAFIRRKDCLTAGTQTNCLTEICFDDAIQRARALDDFQQTHGRLIGPLHGVPISLKDQFNIKGLDTTLGYVGNAFTAAESDAPLVSTLTELGAIIIAKTNLPQMVRNRESPLGFDHASSQLYTHSWGVFRGEAALLALGGSLIGWGTDIGGSIRIPSHINGLWGLKPSSGRMSYKGIMVSLDGQQHVPSAVGPMARSLSSLTLVTKLVIETAPWTIDPQLPPIPWRDNVFDDLSTRQLVIGTMLDDGVVKVHPPVERVFREYVARLKAAGHEVVEWDSRLNLACIEIMDEYYAADGGQDIRDAVAAGGEPVIPQVQAFIDRGKPISVYEYWQLNKRKVASQQAYHDMWTSIRSPSGKPVDVLLVPTMPHTAVPHKSCRWTGYTKLFNLLDYTALTFPAGKASKDLDNPFFPGNAWNWALYDPSLMEGHHVGLQIVGRRFEEEKVLGAAQQIQQLL